VIERRRSRRTTLRPPVVELVWEGKYLDGVRVRPSRDPLPVQTDEGFGGDAARTAGANRLILGDRAHTLPALLSEWAGRFALVYIDPPFDTGDRFDFQATVHGVPDGTPRVPVPAYDDARGLERWLAWFSDTTFLIHELLGDGGSLYVHLDAHVAHYAKVLLDEVFGTGAFQREIVWRIGWVSGFKSRARGWIRNHDTLLFYAKGGRPRTFHKEVIPYPPGYVRRDGAAPRGLGYPVEDVWNASPIDRMDSIQIVSFSGEKVGYPTQKNEALLSRIIRASSDPDDAVLDCFVGSGTSVVVAERQGRRWVGCDIAPIAIHTTRKRLLGLPSVRPFVVQRVGSTAESSSSRAMCVAAKADGRRVALELTSFELGPDAGGVPSSVRAGVLHWSQWLEGWCVDWDYRGGTFQAGSHVWRAPRAAKLPVVATFEYAGPGRYMARVKAFDVLGGSAVAEVAIDVS
jgi:hypothetical protein